MPVRLIVNLPDETLDALRRIARARDTTLTEALKQAIATEDLLVAETRAGHTLVVEPRLGGPRVVDLTHRKG